MTTSNWFWSVTAFLFGVNIGSFLNVVIWRIPRGGSLVKPQFSYCPHCERRLTGVDLIPLFSFLLLGRRCRTCKKPISWRYFTVELLTGLLFFALAIRFRHSAPDAVTYMLFTALLVPAAFIDLEFFAIPESLNAMAFVVAVGRDVLGIVRHEPDHAPLWGWLPRSIVGALAGILIFGAVRVVGWVWKRREAMGLGDVLLARSMGALLVTLVPVGTPLLRLFPAWVLFSCFSGLAVGIPQILGRNRAQDRADAEAERQGIGLRGGEEESDNESDEDSSSLGDQLKDIGYCIVLGDFFDWIRTTLQSKPRTAGDAVLAEPTIAEEDFTPDPTAIPFGPFLSIGFLAAVFVGEALTAWYLLVALPKPGP